MTEKPLKYTLQGDQYLPEPAGLAKRFPYYRKFLYNDIPVALRATEERIRGARGAKNPVWLDKALRWYGCPVAVPFNEVWRRCPNKPAASGYCAPHHKRAGQASAGEETHDDGSR